MTDDYISRQAAMNAFAERVKRSNNSDFAPVPRWNDAVEIVENLPSVDAQPVRHGKWETIEGWDGDELYRCSECGAEFVLIDGTPNDNDYWFCPHCGAKMDGEQKWNLTV